MKIYDLHMSHPVGINVEIWSSGDSGAEINITDNDGFDGAKVPLADIEISLFPDDDKSHADARDKLIQALQHLIERIQSGDDVDLC